jgi:hypothetical protein
VSLLIDGPHGAPSQHVFEVDAAILVGAGIGVTPFVSILRTIIDHIWERRGVNDRRGKPCLPKKVLFFWIGYRPEVEAFRWFLEQLALWEKKFDEIRARPENADLFLDIQLYLTLRTAKDAATDYNQLKVDTRQGLVPISDLDAKMIRKAELRRLEGELTQSRSSKSVDSRQGEYHEEAGASSANPWDSEAASLDSSGMAMPARRRPRLTSPSHAASSHTLFLLTRPALAAKTKRRGRRCSPRERRRRAGSRPRAKLTPSVACGRLPCSAALIGIRYSTTWLLSAWQCLPRRAQRPNPPSTGTTSETGTSCSAAPARSRWRWRRRAGAPCAVFLFARFHQPSRDSSATRLQRARFSTFTARTFNCARPSHFAGEPHDRWRPSNTGRITRTHTCTAMV